MLSLPILLVMLALIINFGTLAVWKARAASAARQAVWRQRADRRGATDPPLKGYPGTLEVTPGQPPLFPMDPYAQHVVARGPILRDPQVSTPEAQLTVDTRFFDMQRGLQIGASHLERTQPLFPRWRHVKFEPQHLLLDGQWQFHNLGGGDVRINIGSNVVRRVWVFYGFAPPDSVRQLAGEFQNAAIAILSDPQRSALDPLDRDQEFVAWYGPPPPDFHPRLEVVCLLDRTAVRVGVVQQLIDLIQGPRGGGRGGVPETMARAFIGLYQSQLNAIQGQMPPPQAQIDALQEKINQLQQFLQTLN